jgi:S-adenosylmethionine:tRNA ribosyltransferase-isomerase
MNVSDLDYYLPPELIAQKPLSQRELSRLMVINRKTKAISHHYFKELPSLLPTPCVLVLNNIKVLPWRIFGQKPTGGKVELLLVKKEKRYTPQKEIWISLAKASKPLKPGMEISLQGEFKAKIKENLNQGFYRIELCSSEAIEKEIQNVGKIPLPPYIRRKATPKDQERYQTVYAQEPGAVAAPTAGLHFTLDLLDKIQRNGAKVLKITLYIGPGTFLPIKTQDVKRHKMDPERYIIPQEAKETILEAKNKGEPIIAVGTSVVRALEGASSSKDKLTKTQGETDLFITSGYSFRIIDGLCTNFHLPRSTSLSLVMTFGGRDLILTAYQEAINRRYRFLSYGDAMLIL